MVDIVKSIYSKIASNPSVLEADIEQEDEAIFVNIYPDPIDAGCIIGKDGKNIKALRNILASYSLVKDDRRKIVVNVDTGDDDEGDY